MQLIKAVHIPILLILLSIGNAYRHRLYSPIRTTQDNKHGIDIVAISQRIGVQQYQNLLKFFGFFC